MLRGIWLDAKADNSFCWRWGFAFAILGLLFNITLFMLMGAIVLTVAICSEMAQEKINRNFGSNERNADEQTPEARQGGTGTAD